MKHGICWMLAAAVLGTAGCKTKGSVPAQEQAVQPQPAAPAHALDPATLGSVTGVVHFTGKAPAPVKIDMSMDPACEMGSSGDNFSQQFVVNNGGLGNVFIYMKSGPASATGAVSSNKDAVVMDQKGCRYTPHVIAVMKGGSVEFRNSDITMHNIHTMPVSVGSESIDISQGPRGTPQTKQFNIAETMIPVRCNNHPWMNAFINVSATPVFAVSDADGKFTLTGLPPGDYTLGAVHEKLGEQTLHVTVTAQKSSDAKFTFAPK